MPTVDEDLVTYLKADATVLRKCGGRIYENFAPPAPPLPFIFFVRTGDETWDALDDAQGVAPNVIRFAVECIGQSLKDAWAIAAAVKARCHKAVKVTFGSRTGVTLWCEDQSDSYEPRAGGPGATGFHVAALQVEVFP